MMTRPSSILVALVGVLTGLACTSAPATVPDGGLPVGTSQGDSSSADTGFGTAPGTGTGSGVAPVPEGGPPSGTGSGSGSSVGAQDSGSETSLVDSSTPDAALTGDFDGDTLDGSLSAFECKVAKTPPSLGSCVTVVDANDGGTGIECNPVTNGQCAAGEACDVNGAGGVLLGFICYPPPNTATACESCDDTTSCAAGFTCSHGKCARYCCTDGDCGHGKCTTQADGTALFEPVSTTLGLCTAM